MDCSWFVLPYIRIDTIFLRSPRQYSRIVVFCLSSPSRDSNTNLTSDPLIVMYDDQGSSTSCTLVVYNKRPMLSDKHSDVYRLSVLNSSRHLGRFISLVDFALLSIKFNTIFYSNSKFNKISKNNILYCFYLCNYFNSVRYSKPNIYRNIYNCVL